MSRGHKLKKYARAAQRAIGDVSYMTCLSWVEEILPQLQGLSKAEKLKVIEKRAVSELAKELEESR